MPLFLRALPLSLLTLWHYVFLFPLVLAVSLPFLMLTVIPLAGFPVIWGVITFIGFAGYRCALAAIGKGNEPSLIKLVLSSLTMGVIIAVSSMLFLALSIAIGTGIGWLGLGETMSLRLGFEIPFAAGLSGLIYIVLTAFFYFSMAVPMTAVAHAATPKGRDIDPFFGFGSGLFSLMISWGLWLFGMIYLGFFEIIGEAIAYGTYQAVEYFVGVDVHVAEQIEPPLAPDWTTFGVSILGLLWGTCWFSATAVLAWDRKVKQKAVVQQEVVAQRPRLSAEDLRALRESRMQGPQDQDQG